jgi:SNF2 family DNA or RNA helicase
MTGTPMMNNVTELYSLIRFCRIKPFDNWESELCRSKMNAANVLAFNNEIGRPLNVNATRRYAPDQSMRKLRGLLCAVMLRRTKKSTLDGKPLVNLPERIVEDDEIELTEEDSEYYNNLESKAQGVINNMMQNGTLGKKYIHALVMLLRLRQACCHPKLVTLLEESSQLEASLETLLDLAMQLGPDVVTRIKAGNGEFECPICLDPTLNPVILLDCGHTTCAECFSTMKQNAEVELPCPVCRGIVLHHRVTDYSSFKKVHEPENVTEEPEEKLEESDSESESDSDDSSDEGSLRDFVVDDESDERPRKVKGKGKETFNSNDDDFVQPMRRKKGKDKGKSLAQLKKEGYRNKKARRRYIRRLRKDYKPSAKINRTLELLGEIETEHPTEKVLIFSQFTTFLDLIEVALEPTGRRFQRYDGSMSGKDRAAAVENFKRDPLSQVMLVSLKAGNAGLNLNFASQVIILDPFWNPYIEDQAIDRAHRIGQRHDVMVHRVIVPGTVEDRILKLQGEKRELINDALDEMESKNLARLGQRDLAYLFGLGPRAGQPAIAGPAIASSSRAGGS